MDTTTQKSGSQRTLIILVLVLLIVGALAYYYFYYDKDEDSSSSNTACSAQTTEATCIAPCVWDGATCEDAPPVFSPEERIDDVPDLAARYTPDGYDVSSKTWTDTKGVNAFGIDGAAMKSSDGMHISGDTLTKFTLPSGLYDRRYTLFTVAKYNGGAKNRIFTSSGGDWYSGHNDGKSGVAKHDDILTEDIDHFGDGWVVSCDQRDMYRANGIRLSGLHYDQDLPENIGVNTNPSSESHFAIGEILVYPRELNMDEIQIIEKFLLDKYVVPPKTYYDADVTNAGVNDIYDAEVDCGENSALIGVRVQEGNTHKYKCMFNMDDFNSDGYVRDNVEDTKIGQYMEDMANQRMDCGTKGLQGYKFRPSGDNSKVSVRYKCAGGLVDSNECEDKTSAYIDVSDIRSHTIDCGDDTNKVLTSVRFKKSNEDTSKGRYEYTCCKPKGY